MKISASKLQNFQIFSERQWIEFGDLTLFGPNSSAGQCVVEDAFFSIVWAVMLLRNTLRTFR